jgi:hypothetical protein
MAVILKRNTYLKWGHYTYMSRVSSLCLDSVLRMVNIKGDSQFFLLILLTEVVKNVLKSTLLKIPIFFCWDTFHFYRCLFVLSINLFKVLKFI